MGKERDLNNFMRKVECAFKNQGARKDNEDLPNSGKKLDESFKKIRNMLQNLASSTSRIKRNYATFLLNGIENSDFGLQEKDYFKIKDDSESAKSLILIDKKGNIKEVNKTTLRLLGYEKKDLIGKPAEKIILPLETLTIKEKGSNTTRIVQSRVGIKRLLLKRESLRKSEVYYLTKDRKRILVNFDKSFIKTSNGKIAGIICIAENLQKGEDALVCKALYKKE
jgi:PAS domain S-box-containing protein